MAQITLGVGTSHTPMLTLEPELWEEYAAGDRDNSELVFPPEGMVMSYDAALESVASDIRDRPRGLTLFRQQHAACMKALDRLGRTLRTSDLDAIVIISDDQDEWFFEDNLPALAVYWGDEVPIKPRPMPRPRSSEISAAIQAGYGSRERIHPTDAKLGRHLVEQLGEQDFDVAQLNYTNEKYGGRLVRRYPTPEGETSLLNDTAPRPIGLPHGFSFVIKRLLEDASIPIVPVFQNTCYPPNHVRPARSYDFGSAIATAIRSWDDDARVAVVASGGLSHFVVDEELDHMVLAALAAGDRETLRGLPRERLYSATSETLNWVALGGAMSETDLRMELLDYVPVYRSEVGTGGGWGFAQWV